MLNIKTLEAKIDEAYELKQLTMLEGYAEGIPDNENLSKEDKSYLVHKVNNYRQVLMLK